MYIQRTWENSQNVWTNPVEAYCIYIYIQSNWIIFPGRCKKNNSLRFQHLVWLCLSFNPQLANVCYNYLKALEPEVFKSNNNWTNKNSNMIREQNIQWIEHLYLFCKDMHTICRSKISRISWNRQHYMTSWSRLEHPDTFGSMVIKQVLYLFERYDDLGKPCWLIAKVYHFGG